MWRQALVLVIVVAVGSAGCAGGKWRKDKDGLSPQQQPWWKRVIPGPHDIFTDSRSREIERRLDRENDVSID